LTVKFCAVFHRNEKSEIARRDVRL